MISETALLWIRIGAGVLLVLIALQGVHAWRTRRMAEAIVLAFLAITELALLPLALAGAIPETASGMPLAAFLVPLGCIALGAGGIVRCVQNRRRARLCAHWPIVAGTITTSRVEVETDADGDESYRADVRFRYRVGDREFEGAAVNWGPAPAFAWRSQAAAALIDYPVGEAVTVHYDPAQPAMAVLRPFDRKSVAMPLVFAAVVGGIGLIVLKVLTSVT